MKWELRVKVRRRDKSHIFLRWAQTYSSSMYFLTFRCRSTCLRSIAFRWRSIQRAQPAAPTASTPTPSSTITLFRPFELYLQQF